MRTRSLLSAYVARELARRSHQLHEHREHWEIMIDCRIVDSGGWFTTCGGWYGRTDPGGAESKVPGTRVIACVPGLNKADGGVIAGDSALAPIR